MRKFLSIIALLAVSCYMLAENSAIIIMTASTSQGTTSKLTLREDISAYSSALDNGYDADKNPNPVESNSVGINFYATCSWGDASKVAEPNLEGLKMSFVSNKITDDVYTITFDYVMGTPYYLKDLMTGTLTEIVAGGTYSFTQAVSTTEERFEIVAVPLAPLTFINNVLVINEATAGAEVSVTPFSYVNGERVMAASLAPLTAPVNEPFPADTYGYLLVEYTNAEGVARKFIINANPDVAPAND